MPRRTFAALILMILAGCSHLAERPANVSPPEIYASLASPIFFGRDTTAAVNLDVEVTNTARLPVTIRRIQVESPGMTQYTLQGAIRTMNETIAAGETKKYALFGTAVARVSGPSVREPLTVRVVADFEAEGQPFREIVPAQTIGR